MDTSEDIHVEATSPAARRFRTRRIAVITLGSVCLATAGVWLLQPSSEEAEARRVLNPRVESETDASPADSTSTTDLIEDVSTVTTEAPTSTDAWIGEGGTTSPAPMNGGVPNGRYWAAYAQGMCDEGFAYPSCSEAIDQYCSQSAPSPWTLPDLTGRPLSDTLTQTEIEHAYADEMCSYGRTPDLSMHIQYVCNADPTASDQVMENVSAIGTPVHSLTVDGGITVVAGRDCTTTTICVEVTMVYPQPTPEDPWPTTTIGWRCA